MKGSRHISPWEMPHCPECDAQIFTDRSHLKTETHVCHQCKYHFSTNNPHPQAGGGQE